MRRIGSILALGIVAGLVGCADSTTTNAQVNDEAAALAQKSKGTASGPPINTFGGPRGVAKKPGMR